ncbi:hypothetical protein BH11BAC1_BH11BAC1_17050 [soil metagenome]
MKMKEILTVPGMSGLYKMIATTKTGFIVESLIDGKRMPVTSTQRVSALGDIFIYRSEEEMPLNEVFKKIKEKDGDKLAIDPKGSDDELKKYFKTIVPDFDESRVHTSHIKKMLTWYGILNGKVDFDQKDDDNETSVLNKDDHEKPITKNFESNAPKADQHAKVTPVKLRKKV